VVIVQAPNGKLVEIVRKGADEGCVRWTTWWKDFRGMQSNDVGNAVTRREVTNAWAQVEDIEYIWLPGKG
jgi:hypothetical protein